MSEIEEVLYAESVLGRDAEDFFKSEIGRYVLARSQELSKVATDRLKATPAHEVHNIRNCQMEIAKAELAVQWLNEQIMAGKQALQQLESMEDETE
jgi:hypothetical protein